MTYPDEMLQRTESSMEVFLFIYPATACNAINSQGGITLHVQYYPILETLHVLLRLFFVNIFSSFEILIGQNMDNAIGIKKKVQICCRPAAFEVYI